MLNSLSLHSVLLCVSTGIPESNSIKVNVSLHSTLGSPFRKGKTQTRMASLTWDVREYVRTRR